MVREDVENLSELSEDVKYVKRELERQNKLTFLAKKFLAEKNLDDLEEYKEKEVDKVLTDLGANTVDVEDKLVVAFVAMCCKGLQCDTMRRNATQCDTMRYNAIQCDTMRYNATQCDTMQYNAI